MHLRPEPQIGNAHTHRHRSSPDLPYRIARLARLHYHASVMLPQFRNAANRDTETWKRYPPAFAN